MARVLATKRSVLVLPLLGVLVLLRRPLTFLISSTSSLPGSLRTTRGVRGTLNRAVGTVEASAIGARLDVLDAVLSAEEIERTVLAARTLAGNFRNDADSVDGQPSFELEFITSGEWRPDATDLQSALEGPLEALRARVQEMYLDQDIMISQALIRRYAVGERRAHPVHYDHNALITAVGSLTPPVPGSGLYIQHGAGTSSREFIDLREAGNFAVHGWDLAHGVSVQASEERYSLIVWFKPSSDVASGGTGWYQALADSGNAVAQYRVGMNLESSGDPVSAMQWFERAAEQGHWSSMHRLGLIFFRQRGDLDGAERWLTAAAQMGYAPAQVELGDLLAARSGEKPSRQSTIGSWYAAASDQGHPAGQHRLAVCSMKDGDEQTAYYLLTDSAEQGWADAQFELGRISKRTDPQKASEWFDLAIRQGHPGAMSQSAIMCSQSNQHEKARDLLQQAAELGHVTSMKNLAMYLSNGVGGPEDEQAAVMWSERAAQLVGPVSGQI